MLLASDSTWTCDASGQNRIGLHTPKTTQQRRAVLQNVASSYPVAGDNLKPLLAQLGHALQEHTRTCGPQLSTTRPTSYIHSSVTNTIDQCSLAVPSARHSVMYAKASASNNAGERPQVRSALGSLKRTWSGNQHDLGSTAQTSQTRTGFKSGAPPSSQEIFYEWSPSPSPPPTASRSAVRNSDSDKENGFGATAAKRTKVATASSDKSSAFGQRPIHNGFVAASTIHRSASHGSAVASSSASNSAYGRSDAGASYQSQPNRSDSRSSSITPTAQQSTASARNLPWTKSASQLKSEKRNDPEAYRASSLVSSVGGPSGSRASTPSTIASGPDGKKSVNKIFLSQEQRKVLSMVVDEGKNVFFTGSAGTGKSVLLREIIRELRRKHSKSPDAVAVTASTGIAACNIGGVTIHSFAGIGLGKEPVAQLVSKIRKNRKATGRWSRTQVLIIDEISMVDPALLDKLEEIARVLRKKPKPFGGIQIVITGDFFQLPPVNPGGSVTFAFDAQCWEHVVQHKVNLTQVFRQKDSSFVTMLNEMRFGKLSQKTIEAFKKLERVPQYDGDIVPTELFPMRNEVDAANAQRLNALQAESQTYRAQDGGSLQAEARERVLQNSIALPVLHVKKGAQVMLIKNIDETLVNGSIGKVVDFVDEMEHARLAGDLESHDQMNAEREKMTRMPGRKWPLVRFHVPGGGTRDYLAMPETWKTELPDGEIQASRSQVPLILAWAMSIHKSQGQTLPCCKINLNRVFEKGQAYVALSRATSIEGLQVLGFQASKVMAHPRVIEWSKSLIALGE